MTLLIHKIKRNIKTVLARIGILDGFRKPFDYIEFETTVYCNRKCSYCPVSMHKRNGDEENVFMSDRTFEKLLSDLKEMSFKGRLAPHLYGEPLSDPRLLRWIARIKEVLPESTIRVVTNGDYLNRKKYDELIAAGITYFDVSKHSENFPTSLNELLTSLSEEERNHHFQFNDFYEDYKTGQKMLNTRGGEVKLKAPKEHPILCGYVIYPVINTFGEVVLCCNDYHSSHKFGNINERSLREIWYDSKNMKLRRRIYQGIFDSDLCKNCYM